MDNRKTFCNLLSMHWNISTLITKQQREKRLEVSRYFGRTIRPSSGDLKKKALKKDGLSVQNIGKPQVAFLFAVFFINVYIFVLDRTGGFGSRHFIYKKVSTFIRLNLPQTENGFIIFLICSGFGGQGVF